MGRRKEIARRQEANSDSVSFYGGEFGYVTLVDSFVTNLFFFLKRLDNDKHLVASSPGSESRVPRLRPMHKGRPCCTRRSEAQSEAVGFAKNRKNPAFFKTS